MVKHGILLQLGNEKNVNKNAVAEKAIQELEYELLKENPSNLELNEILLSKATYNLNNRIRYTKRSAKELWFRRDQNTGEDLEINDKHLSDRQFQRRTRDNTYKSKGEGLQKEEIKRGDIVVIRSEQRKDKNRETYLVTQVDQDEATCIKTNARSRGTPYKVKTEDLFIIRKSETNKDDTDSSSSEDNVNQIEHTDVDEIEPQENQELPEKETQQRKSTRQRKRIAYGILNKSGKRVEIKSATSHCMFCKKSRYKYYQHNMNTCKRAIEARKIIKPSMIRKETSDSSDSEREENETIKQVKIINDLAVKIVTETRQQYVKGLQMNEFYPLLWEDFENLSESMSESYEEIQDENMNILDRHHLLSFADAYMTEEDIETLSGDDIVEDTIRSPLRRNSSDRWSI